MGSESTSDRAFVRGAGQGYRMQASALQEEFKRAPVMHLLLRYTAALISQIAQTAVCNRHHTLDQRRSRESVPRDVVRVASLRPCVSAQTMPASRARLSQRVPTLAFDAVLDTFGYTPMRLRSID